MGIRIRATGQVMFWSEFRELLLSQNPKELITVLPQTEEWLNAHGADPVFEGPQAVGGTVYQYSVRQGVELGADGKWYTKYVLGPIFVDIQDANGNTITAAQQEADHKNKCDAERIQLIKETRNNKLKESDWTQLKDIPESISSQWTTYRQALRDITLQSGYPWTVVWPTKPE